MVLSVVVGDEHFRFLPPVSTRIEDAINQTLYESLPFNGIPLPYDINTAPACSITNQSPKIEHTRVVSASCVYSQQKDSQKSPTTRRRYTVDSACVNSVISDIATEDLRHRVLSATHDRTEEMAEHLHQEERRDETIPSDPLASTGDREQHVHELESADPIFSSPPKPETKETRSTPWQRMSRCGSSVSLYSLPTNFRDVDDGFFGAHVSDVDDRASINSIPASTTSSISPRPNAIYLINNQTLQADESAAVFAQEVTVGEPLKVGDGYRGYIVYTCTVKNNTGANIVVRKRYSDFVALRNALLKQYPFLKKSGLPHLPPKRVVGKFNVKFIEHRRGELEYFLSYVLLHPTLGSSAIVSRWMTG
ncbi:uncharacterized protein VTP21DRAFT_6629 [Calcarisporiella thermophila]|uniref:uncharacterized protein n=1 Tax=Calcarisporiella thermophila TaxID=911321 RepID=UPI003744A568